MRPGRMREGARTHLSAWACGSLVTSLPRGIASFPLHPPAHLPSPAHLVACSRRAGPGRARVRGVRRRAEAAHHRAHLPYAALAPQARRGGRPHSNLSPNLHSQPDSYPQPLPGARADAATRGVRYARRPPLPQAALTARVLAGGRLMDPPSAASPNCQIGRGSFGRCRFCVWGGWVRWGGCQFPGVQSFSSDTVCPPVRCHPPPENFLVNPSTERDARERDGIVGDHDRVDRHVTTLLRHDSTTRAAVRAKPAAAERSRSDGLGTPPTAWHAHRPDAAGSTARAAGVSA